MSEIDSQDWGVMGGNQPNWGVRLENLREIAGPLTVSRQPDCPCETLLAVTCSRLGHDAALHRRICQFLCRSMLECRQGDVTLLIVPGSAIEPWVRRAAELFSIPHITLSVDRHNETADLVIQPVEGELSRDAAAILIADRVDALFVRRGGTMDHWLQQRLLQRRDISTRVAVSMTGKCAAPTLIQAGAIGWYCPPPSRNPPPSSHRGNGEPGVCDSPLHEHGVAEEWTRTDGKWLIHCTRGPAGPWPGETERQYRDSLLVGVDKSADRGPLESLCRILHFQRLVACSKVTTQPVVCFSALPLTELLARRQFRPQLSRWDYEPYGVAVHMAAASRLGIEPVIYGDPKDRAALPHDQRYRFHPMGRTFDWRREREWRCCRAVDLSGLDPSEVRVFAKVSPVSRLRLSACRFPVTFVS